MSEAITKACGLCNGTGKTAYDWGWCDCPDCSGTGRVPDVEATLREEVARLTAELADANFARATMIEGCDSLGNQLTAARAANARLTAEVERLRAREKEVEGMTTDDDGYCVVCEALSVVCEMYPEQCIRSAWLAGCKS